MPTRTASIGASLLASLLVAGCPYEPLDHSAKSCPCAPGYVCVDDRCVGTDRDAATDGGGLVFVDAGPLPPSQCESLVGDPDIILCDGFEYDIITESRWRRPASSSLGTIGQTSELAYRGNSSLRARFTDAPASGYRSLMWAFELPDPLDTAGDRLWARAYLRVGATSEVRDFAFSEFVGGYGPGEQIVFVKMEEADTYNLWGNVGSNGPNATVEFPRARWECVEIDFVAAEPGYMQMRLEGDPAAELDYQFDSILDPPLSVVSLGVRAEASQGPVDIYFDEVVLSRRRIPCN